MKIIVHSKNDCPYCTKAKQYLEDNSVPYTEILHDDVWERNEFYDSIGLTEGQRTVPQIFVEESSGILSRIGGYSQLIASDVVARARLDDMDLDGQDF